MQNVYLLALIHLQNNTNDQGKRKSRDSIHKITPDQSEKHLHSQAVNQFLLHAYHGLFYRNAWKLIGM